MCDPVAGCLHAGACVDAGVDAEAGSDADDADAGDVSLEAAPGDAVEVTDGDALEVADVRPDGADADGSSSDTARIDAVADGQVDGMVDARADLADVRVDSRADVTDARPAASSSDGCGCFTGGSNETTPSLAWMLVLGLLMIRRRPSRRQR
jgi:hypothetical protein